LYIINEPSYIKCRYKPEVKWTLLNNIGPTRVQFCGCKGKTTTVSKTAYNCHSFRAIVYIGGSVVYVRKSLALRGALERLSFLVCICWRECNVRSTGVTHLPNRDAYQRQNRVTKRCFKRFWIVDYLSYIIW